MIRERTSCMEAIKGRLGLVSVDAPLISNLNVLGNIALIKQYHENWTQEKATRMVEDYLRRFHHEDIIRKRNPSLSEEERFCAMLLRAVMVSDAVIVIDRPLMILPNLQDSRFFYHTLHVVEDLFRECHIFDYRVNQHRYELIYGT